MRKFTDSDMGSFRLLRCNGIHPSRHTNHLERENDPVSATFGPCFHIHQATQRYQEVGRAIDGYAVPTTEYSNYETALEYFVRIANFQDPDPSEFLPLFGSGGGDK